VRVVGGRLVDFWESWCRGAVVVVVVRWGIGYVVEVVVEVDEEFGGIAEVAVVEDWCWVGVAFCRVEVPTSAFASEGCRWCTVAPRALLALC
jgi:hypothetical protein